MRWLFFILLCPLGLFAQKDSLSLRFEDTSLDLTYAQQVTFQDFIADRTIFKLQITAYVGSHESVSRNRTRVEKRLVSLKNVCQAKGISKNDVQVEYKIITDESKFNSMKLELYFKAIPTTGVVYQTNKIEITEVYPVEPKKQAKDSLPIEKKEDPIVEKKSARDLRQEAKARKDSSTRTEQELAQEKKNTEAKNTVKTYGPLNIDDFKQGAQIVIPKLLFYATRHKLERSSIPSLKALLEIMRDKPTLVIQLQGHICCKKDGEDGMDFDTGTGNLSENRARVVHDFLIANGISPKRLSYVGYGSKYKRVEDNGNAFEGKQNRRVEIFVVSE